MTAGETAQAYYHRIEQAVFSFAVTPIGPGIPALIAISAITHRHYGPEARPKISR
jgi:hypothetical protein